MNDSYWTFMLIFLEIGVEKGNVFHEMKKYQMRKSTKNYRYDFKLVKKCARKKITYLPI